MSSPLPKLTMEVLAVHKILSQDFLESYRMVKTYDQMPPGYEGHSTEFWARIMYRSLFALIEGSVAMLKKITYVWGREENYSFTHGEIAFLTERGFVIKNARIEEEEPLKIGFKDNLKLSFALYSKILGIIFHLDLSGEGWQACLRTLEVRDGLMHPKSLNDVLWNPIDHVSDAGTTFTWFVGHFAEAMERGKQQSLPHQNTSDALL